MVTEDGRMACSEYISGMWGTLMVGLVKVASYKPMQGVCAGNKSYLGPGSKKGPGAKGGSPEFVVELYIFLHHLNHQGGFIHVLEPHLLLSVAKYRRPLPEEVPHKVVVRTIACLTGLL